MEDSILKKYPNDFDLGKALNDLNLHSKLIKKYPNYAELGSVYRGQVNSFFKKIKTIL